MHDVDSSNCLFTFKELLQVTHLYCVFSAFAQVFVSNILIEIKNKIVNIVQHELYLYFICKCSDAATRNLLMQSFFEKRWEIVLVTLNIEIDKLIYLVLIGILYWIFPNFFQLYCYIYIHFAMLDFLWNKYSTF